ncbi:hypothetical protein [Streptomyces sp. NPDC088915]|uniref:hypothetical protein n=1 Tax=Streptomyces sp. NPDC088915 TaxID=3365912 RepID=UPI003802E990
MSYHEGNAERLADKAAGRTGDEYRTDVIGEGLAAIAHALLEVATAIREASDKD